MIGAGLAWMTGAAFLFLRAMSFSASEGFVSWWLVLAGIAAGLSKGFFVLVPLARRNVERIRELSPEKERICLFAFQPAKSYLLVGLMILSGVVLRTIGLSSSVLLVVYVTIACALGVSSLVYFQEIWLKGGKTSGE